jgi:hypothetical protein
VSDEGDAIYARKIAHNALLQAARTNAENDGGVAQVKFYGAGQYNFGDYEDISAEEYRVEFISKNGSTFTVVPY